MTASQSAKKKKKSYSTVAQANLILILILLPHSELPNSLRSLPSLPLRDLCRSGLPGTHCIAQAGFQLMMVPLLDLRSPGVLELSHHIRLFFIFRKKFVNLKEASDCSEKIEVKEILGTAFVC